MGLFLFIGCVVNLYLDTELTQKYKKYIKYWLLFSILGFIIHLFMSYKRNQYNINDAILLKNMKPSNRLLLCTIGQIIVLVIYYYTRHIFTIQWISDIFAYMIITTIIIRFIVFSSNRFKYTDKLLFKNIYERYV